ncbi:MAG TPA: class I SAM-dependent methyltransferase [Tepidisphaeraceae bacterium]|jgi:trans-aconitate methyltransferase|nr:class I SAM-dependent methyltransferase [Tepidisphaeraceae bacterium]
MPPPAYLRPYLEAAERHGAKFESLLWANPSAQAARFAALARWSELNGRIVLDAGCGRADLLEYLLDQRIQPARYIGIEAVEALAEAAETNNRPHAAILRGDFVDQPALLDQHAHVIVFCGSLNTLSPDDFYQTLRLAWQYTHSELAFNFLCSPRLASGKHLTWHPISDVQEFAYSLSSDIALDDSYRKGDCTIVIRKAE